ncbi:mobile mystery protein A [Endozoicomonas sp. 4G]|uniref:mobile mystery protein A n=1 Tax=Endozoicomonas sp. 4G TaxID=2872754 RepID=UPI0020786300|nr:mobile mystery protein A [Endozoicomonas sp. 4G]
MNWDKELNLQQIDETLGRVRPMMDLNKPVNGWINAIRTALGMSARVLGERVGLSQSGVALMEKNEVTGSISLRTLEKAAEGLGCRVVYVLVPENQSLAAMREKQAMDKARTLNQYAERHMELEDQATDMQFQNANTKKLAEEYLRTWPRDFWDNL